MESSIQRICGNLSNILTPLELIFSFCEDLGLKPRKSVFWRNGRELKTSFVIVKDDTRRFTIKCVNGEVKLYNDPETGYRELILTVDLASPDCLSKLEIAIKRDLNDNGNFRVNIFLL